MREYTSPGAVKVAPSDNPVSSLMARADTHPQVAALAYRDGNRFVDVSTRDFADKVESLAGGLVSLGLAAGARVAIFSSTRIEYTYLQYAAWAAGLTTVTIYDSSSPEQVKWIMSDSEAQAIFCETDVLRAVYEEVAHDLPHCRNAFVIEDGAVDEILAMGGPEEDEEVKRRTSAITHEDLALLIYTSGTTGRPKGCMLNHYNFIWTVRQAVAAIPQVFAPGESNLMFLPLAHSFAQIVQVGCVSTGVKIGYSGIPTLVEDLSTFKPTWIFAAPRVFEKVYNSAKLRAEGDGKGKIFDLAAKTAMDYSREIETGSVSLKTRLLYALFDRLVYGKLRNLFGGRLVHAISGSAPLGERLGHFFRGIGLTVLEGYGLTETNSATCVNRPDDIRIGTIGRPLPGWSMAIADDGEILIKGGGVFKGYWNNEAATAEVFDQDGWFHSGDVGEMSDDGYFRITGRKKELIVTAGGKNVAPAVLEDRLRAHPLVSQCMVIGDAQPFIAALITIDTDTLPEWGKERGVSGDLAEAIGNPVLIEEIQSAVDDANKAVSRAESIREFRILPDDFTIDGGELTPTLKVKRSIIGKKYGSVINEIYTK
jgi:long-chain acyl-CoA synthetase